MNIWKKRVHVFFQYKDLWAQLVVRDIKLKYRRSVLGYVWSILNPLLIMIVLTLVFSAMFSRNITNYPIYLITGRTIYTFFYGFHQCGNAFHYGKYGTDQEMLCAEIYFYTGESDQFHG